MKVLTLIVAGLLSQTPQGDTDRMVAAVRSAVSPALPFPKSDADGSLPANGNTEALWMVRPLPSR
jgi:hypothetical protein